MNFKGAKCFSCGKIGHIQKACRSVLPKKRNFPQRSRSDHRSVVQKPRKALPNHKPQPIRRLTEGGGTTDFLVNQLHSDNNNPIELTMDIDNKPLKMELDTGVSVSLISAKTFATLQSSRQLQKSNTVLRTYSGEQIRVVGNIDVSVKYNAQVVTLPLLVIEGEGPSLLGRNWLKHIKLDWKSIHIMKGDNLQLMLERHRGAFRDGLGKLQGYQAKIIIEPEATPKFCKARTVPYSMKVKIEEELDRLVSLGILQPVQFSDWATPIVPVLKSDKNVRICGDFKVTVNPVSKLDRYPIPRIEDLFATLGGGTTFTKLDMSQAYQQIELEDSSRQCTVINTHKGLFQYNRLPFGISSAPAIFQRVMESLLQGIAGVVVYLDDVLVTGRTNEENLESLELVLKRMEEAGLLLKKEKCSFMASSVTYLGHVIDADGLRPIVEKVDAIKEAPSPKNLTQLKSYLGLLTYYNRFLPNLSTVLFPLYRLLRKKNPWTWTTKEETAFKASKELLISSNLLVHFDPSLELILACDASPYGIGAVIAHRMPDGSEKPIGFVSRTLTPAEKNYSQLEKEGLACVFGIKKFHSYLFGRSFSIYTDNLPLKSLFSEKQAVPVQASGRILRWALTLVSYEYKILFRPTHKHGNADALSRLPCPNTTAVEDEVPAELVLLLEAMNDLPLTAESIQDWTRKDPILSRVYKYIQHGLPQNCPEEFRAFNNRKSEFSTLNGCILCGCRVVIPPQGRNHLLSELHHGHPGITKMKSLARMYTWWPKIDEDIERVVKGCTKCQENQSNVPSVPLQPWKWPVRPWTRLHIDYAGPFMNSMFFIIVDAHSKWVEIFRTPSTTSATVIQCLRSTFTRFGLPQTIVSDNASNFTSLEFEEFLKLNGVTHVTTTPYHPQSNGLAERMVQSFKAGMRKMVEGTVDIKLARFLFSYRTTPHSTTGITPAELMFGRQLRTRFDLLQPDVASKVSKKQEQQKRIFDTHTKDRNFNLGDYVYARNFLRHSLQKWLPGKIVGRSGNVTFTVQLENNNRVRRHKNHIRNRTVERIPELDCTLQQQVDQTTQHARLSENSANHQRYPTRIRNPPQRYSDEVWT